MKVGKQNYYLLISLFAASSLFAQSPFDAETLSNFKKTNQDSIFLNKNSDIPYQLETFDFIYNKDTTGNEFYSDLLLGKIGQVYGPYNSDTSIFYIKIINADTSFKARVGNIWIDIKKDREAAFEQANRILTEVKGGKDYNLYCIMYSDDRNKKTDCDLGWIYNKIMLEPFATEITNHKKDEVYLVETSFGFHVVKSLADPYKERQLVKYVSLVRKNNRN
jgi:parvulin-like peptidyl-prolyl isomerase